MNLIEAWFDGVCEPKNPGGHGAWGAVVWVDGRTVYEEGGYCGHGPSISNNVAEYSGAVAALTAAKKHTGVIVLRGDSKLVINQLKGEWKVNGGLYMPFYQRAKALRDELQDRLNLVWVPRAENEICDVLSKQVLHDRGIEFRIQPEARRA